jgi:hypothetical protein
MSTTLRVHEVNFVSRKIASIPTLLEYWNIEINNGSKSVKMKILDPSSTLSSQGLPGLGAEETITWYLDDYGRSPSHKLWSFSSFSDCRKPLDA